MIHSQFGNKWQETLRKDRSEEFSVFVRPGSSERSQRQLFLKQYYHFIRRSVGIRPLHDVLEMGCGRGTVSLYFALYDHLKTSLCDIEAPAVELAKQNFVFHGAEGEVIVSKAEETPYTDESFDLVFSIGLLEHLEDYSPIVREKFRVVRRGGTVASLNIPQKTSIQILNTWYRSLLHLFGYKKLKPDYYRNSHTPEQYKAAFENAGFTDVRIFYVTPFPLFTPLPKPLEYLVTLFYRALLRVRRIFSGEPFVTNRYVAQAHFITARKP